RAWCRASGCGTSRAISAQVSDCPARMLALSCPRRSGAARLRQVDPVLVDQPHVDIGRTERRNDTGGPRDALPGASGAVGHRMKEIPVAENTVAPARGLAPTTK